MYSKLAEIEIKCLKKGVCQVVLRFRELTEPMVLTFCSGKIQNFAPTLYDLPEAFPSPDPVSPIPNFFFSSFVNSFPALLLISRSKTIFTINGRFSQNAFNSNAWITAFYLFFNISV